MPPVSVSDREREIYDQAAAIAAPDRRSAFLIKACAGDAPLMRRLQDLLEKGGAPSAFLPEHPADELRTPEDALDCVPGTRIDRYRLLKVIGEGGFGVVFKAEQIEPLRRLVAVKVIKPGMDSREVILRFEAERQALALMDHPNIARVFDAGTTGNGRPYFAMELVEGLPITQFCDQHRLKLEARLELFIDVCSAVQHAHQKGIIHRDLKPSNLLVTLQGGRPRPKVIDFGIAKATQQSLTDRTVYTHLQQFLGTPAYMSPEQASGHGPDVDTRSDLYSLGVLLYELLTGSPPFDPGELHHAGFDEMRRIIREQEPLRPSSRIRRSSPSTSSGNGLRNSLSGDLDWIVLKALAKDPAHRYATVNGLAADLRRHLDHEPVTAVAPTAGYHLAKFCRRHRTLVAAVGVFAGLLVVSAGICTRLALRARRAEAIARTEAATAVNVSEFLWKEVFKQLTPWEHTNRSVSLRSAFDLAATRIAPRLSNQPLAESSVRFSFGKAYVGLSEFGSAETNLLRALELRRSHTAQPDARTADILYDLGILRQFQNRTEEAEALFDEAATIRRSILGAHHRDTLTASAKAVLTRVDRLSYEEAEPLLRQSMETLRRGVGPEAAITVATMNWLGTLLSTHGRFEEAGELFHETYQIAVRENGPASSGALWSLELMATTRAREGRLEDADRAMLELISVRERVNGTNHVFTLQSRLVRLEQVLVPQGRFPEAAAEWMDTASRVRTHQPTLLPALARTHQGLLSRWETAGGDAGFLEFRRTSRDSVPPEGSGPRPSPVE